MYQTARLSVGLTHFVPNMHATQVLKNKVKTFLTGENYVKHQVYTMAPTNH
jgi:hypothetical protein